MPNDNTLDNPYAAASVMDQNKREKEMLSITIMKLEFRV